MVGARVQRDLERFGQIVAATDGRPPGRWRRAGDAREGYLFDGRRRRRETYAAGWATPPRSAHIGKGPRGWRRSDERVYEDVCRALTDHPDIDATDIEVTVSEGVVTLAGTVDERQAKWLAEDLAHTLPGVRDVRNEMHLRGTVAAGAGVDGLRSHRPADGTAEARPLIR